MGQFAGRTARRAASNQASEFDFFYLCEKELILDDVSVIALGLSSGIEQSIQVDSITSKRHILFQNSHQPCYFASVGIAFIFLESEKIQFSRNLKSTSTLMLISQPHPSRLVWLSL